MEALQKNATWEIVPLPEEKKTVGCKWVFMKRMATLIDIKQGQLVANGYTQR